jgi:hypothetical protein
VPGIGETFLNINWVINSEEIQTKLINNINTIEARLFIKELSKLDFPAFGLPNRK